MNDAVPDSAVRLTAVFWSHTDTSFSGFIQVGKPLSIGGGAFAWHEGSALRISSISDEGDTLLWSSIQSDDSIGGRYSVLGGPRRGQGGTWRAARTKGRDLSTATLRAGGLGRIAALFDALPGILVVAAFIVFGFRWVTRRPGPPLLDPATVNPFAAPSRGVGGWLAFFVLGQCFTVGALAWSNIPSLARTVTGSLWWFGAAIALLRPLLTFELLFAIMRFTLSIIGLYLIFKRSRFTPRFWFAYLTLNILFCFIDMGGAAILHGQIDSVLRNGATTAAIDTSRTSARSETLRMLVYAILWSAYWAKSVRVQLTFGSLPLSESAQRTSITSPSPAPGTS